MRQPRSQPRNSLFSLLPSGIYQCQISQNWHFSKAFQFYLLFGIKILSTVFTVWHLIFLKTVNKTLNLAFFDRGFGILVTGKPGITASSRTVYGHQYVQDLIGHYVAQNFGMKGRVLRLFDSDFFRLLTLIFRLFPLFCDFLHQFCDFLVTFRTLRLFTLLTRPPSLSGPALAPPLPRPSLTHPARSRGRWRFRASPPRRWRRSPRTRARPPGQSRRRRRRRRRTWRGGRRVLLVTPDLLFLLGSTSKLSKTGRSGEVSSR